MTYRYLIASQGAFIWWSRPLTRGVAGPLGVHISAGLGVYLSEVELVEAVLQAAVLWIILLAVVVQVRPQPMQREPGIAATCH